MLDYLICTVFIIIFISFLAGLGKSLRKNVSFSENLIYGFIVYTCVQFVGGFIVQQFRLPWVFFQGYMYITLIGLLIISIKGKGYSFKYQDILGHFKKYYIIYIIAILFVVLACLNIQYLWNANNIDDGYYLNKIRMAPYVQNFVDYNYAVGVDATESIVRTINTFEIEGAFFTQMLGVDAAVYAKIFMALFNYVLLLHAVYWFFITVLKDNKLLRNAMFAIIPVLFFGIYQELFANFGIMYLQDSWQFNTAMWYGSTLVRSIGVFLLITPLIANKFTLTKSYIIYFVLCCVALFSKATQMLPLAVIVMLMLFIYKGLAYLKRRVGIKVSLAYLVAILVALLVLPFIIDVSARADVVNAMIGKNMGTILIKISIFLIAVSYLLEIKTLRIWNNCLILMGALLLIPKLNTLFLITSVFDFVAARTITMYFFALIVTAILIFYLLVSKVLIRRRYLGLGYSAIAVVLVIVPFISIQRNLGIANSIKVVADNPKLIPTSTLQLGEVLKDVGKRYNTQLKVMSPAWVNVDNTPHALASTLRYNNFDLVSVSAIPRYDSQSENSIYKDYTEEVQEVYEFFNNGIKVDHNQLLRIFDKYKVNCLITYYDEPAKMLVDDFGYELVDTIKTSSTGHNYSVLYKEMS